MSKYYRTRASMDNHTNQLSNKSKRLNNLENGAQVHQNKKAKGRKNKCVIELKDTMTQTAIETKEISCQTTSVTAEAVNADELKLLKLENCSLKNSYDSLKEESNQLRKNNAELLTKVELMSKQVQFADEIIESNEKLKKEICVLKDKVSDTIIDKNEGLQNQVSNLEEKLKQYSHVSEKNEKLQSTVVELENNLKIAHHSVESMKMVLSMCEVDETGVEVLNPVKNQKLKFNPRLTSDSESKKVSSNMNSNNRYKVQQRNQWKVQNYPTRKQNWDQKPYNRKTNMNWNRNGHPQSRVFHNKNYQNQGD